MLSGYVPSGMGPGHIHPNPISCDHSENPGFDYRMEQLHRITGEQTESLQLGGDQLWRVKCFCPVCSEVRGNPWGYLTCSQNHPTRRNARLYLHAGSLFRPLLDLNSHRR